MASQGFKLGNSTVLDNSDPQGTKQGKQNTSSSHKQHADNDPPRNRDIPSEAQHYGDVADNAHDIKKAERALHDELSESRFAAGHPTGGTGSAPGGPAPSRSS